MNGRADGRHPRLRRLAVLALMALGVAALTALGTWQLERRTWKLALLQQIEERAHAPAVAPPGPGEWPRVSAARDAYRRVVVTGRYLNDRETLVRAVTRLGEGFWVLTPLQTREGFLVLVNRGFVPPERRAIATRSEGELQGETTVTGLLRIGEPGGGFLRANDPASDRWYSRDVAAIASARRLGSTAPYFIDADAGPVPGGWPVGGLTVLDLPNNHLQYALTWFALALMLLGAAIRLTREPWQDPGGGPSVSGDGDAPPGP